MGPGFDYKAWIGQKCPWCKETITGTDISTGSFVVASDATGSYFCFHPECHRLLDDPNAVQRTRPDF